MKSIGKVFNEVLDVCNHRCEQCGAPEVEGRKLRPYFIDGCRSIVTRENVVALCPGCMSHVASTWPPGSNWRFGAPAWAINRGHFRKVPLAEVRAGGDLGPADPAEGLRVGGAIRKVLDDSARKRSSLGQLKKKALRQPQRP